MLVDRYSEREEKKKEGRLLSQAEKEAQARDAAKVDTDAASSVEPAPAAPST